MMAVLANEPFRLPPSEIKRLTPTALLVLYFREREQDGRIKLRPADPSLPPITPRDIHFLFCEFKKIPRWKAEQMWKAKAT